MVEAKNIVMEFDLYRGKVKSLKERLISMHTSKISKKMFLALNDVSLTVKKGEILGILGKNGAGKSTLLKILSGIMEPTKGSVKIEGSIAPMIELGTGFDFEMSALENIFLSGAILGYNKKFIEERVNDIFDFSELWEFKDVPIKYFSSGMLARLAFSVSTIVIPDVLIVDEILSVGDISFQKKSYKRMLKLMKGGTTVIYVSHDIDSLKAISHRVIWLERGEIRMEGSPEFICNEYLKEV